MTDKLKENKTMSADATLEKPPVETPPTPKSEDLPKVDKPDTQIPSADKEKKAPEKKEEKKPTFTERYEKAIKDKEDTVKGLPNGIIDAKEGKKPTLEEVAEQVSNLQKENEKLAKERDTAVKRQSDTHRAFHEKSAELKTLKESQKSIEDEIETRKKEKESADTSEKKDSLKDLLTDEEREILEDNEELGSIIRKVNDKNDNLQQENDDKKRLENLELEKAKVKQMESELEKDWLDSARNTVPDLDNVLKNPDFNVWIEANPSKMAEIRKDRDEYDPSWLVDSVNAFKNYSTAMDRMINGKKEEVNQMLSPRQEGIPAQDKSDNQKRSFQQRYQDAWNKKSAQMGR